MRMCLGVHAGMLGKDEQRVLFTFRSCRPLSCPTAVVMNTHAILHLNQNRWTCGIAACCFVGICLTCSWCAGGAQMEPALALAPAAEHDSAAAGQQATQAAQRLQHSSTFTGAVAATQAASAAVAAAGGGGGSVGAHQQASSTASSPARPAANGEAAAGGQHGAYHHRRAVSEGATDASGGGSGTGSMGPPGSRRVPAPAGSPARSVNSAYAPSTAPTAAGGGGAGAAGGGGGAGRSSGWSILPTFFNSMLYGTSEAAPAK